MCGRGRRIDVADNDESAVFGSPIERERFGSVTPGIGRLDLTVP